MKPAFADRLLGMMAVEKGLVTEKQLTACLNALDFDEGESLVAIMLARRLVTEKHVEKLHAILDRQAQGPLPDREISTRMFGQLAVRMRAVVVDQLHECLDEQGEFAAQGVKYPIGQILMSHDLLTPDQVERILEQQGKRALRCAACRASYLVVRYRDDIFYRCKLCENLLDEAPIEPVPRSVIEERIERARDGTQDEEDRESDLRIIDL